MGGGGSKPAPPCYRYVTRWRIQYYDNRPNIQQSKTQYDHWEGVVNNTESLISQETQKLTNVNNDIDTINNIYKTIKGMNSDERNRKIKDNINSYLNKNVKLLINSYDPSFISNNNKIYLMVTSWDRVSKSIQTFHNESFQYSKPAQGTYNVPDLETNYKDIVTVDENIVKSVFYEPPGGLIEVEKYLSDIVLLYNVFDELLLNIKEPGTYFSKNYGFSEEEKLIAGVTIMPGYKVTITGAKGVIQIYDQPKSKDIPKVIKLDRTFIMSEEDDALESEMYNYIVSKVVVEALP